MILLNDKTFYQMFIANVRYAMKRDNHLAPSTIINTFTQYREQIDKMDSTWKWALINQLIEEIARELKINNLVQAQDWKDFITYLKQIGK